MKPFHTLFLLVFCPMNGEYLILYLDHGQIMTQKWQNLILNLFQIIDWLW
jgi:hypothetical protein